MRLGIDVGVDAQADPRACGPPARRPRESTSSSPSLSTLKQSTPSVERARHLGAGLADAGEHHPRRVAAGGQHALELAARDDVEAAAGRANLCSTARVEFAFMA